MPTGQISWGMRTIPIQVLKLGIREHQERFLKKAFEGEHCLSLGFRIDNDYRRDLSGRVWKVTKYLFYRRRLERKDKGKNKVMCGSGWPWESVRGGWDSLSYVGERSQSRLLVSDLMI